MTTTPKKIIFDEESRECLHKGIKVLVDVVSCTLGPKGRNIGLEKSWGAPTITNDGRNIVKDISLPDTYENMGVEMAKEVVEKIKEKCGDGTTTGAVILECLVDSGLKYIASGSSPAALVRGMEKALKVVVDSLEEAAIPIKNIKETREVAVVSANGNEAIGDFIAEAMEKVGTSGVITIEEGKGTETTTEVVEGMQFDRGYLSPHFCTNTDKMIVEMNNPQILLVDKKINNIHEIIPVLQTTASSGSELLIIAEDIEEGEALSTLVLNKLRGTIKVCAVKAPGFGDRRKAMLEDIAALTGATVINDDVGINLKDVNTELLGGAERIIINKEETVIVSGKGSAEAIKARIMQIDNEINSCTSTYDKEKLEERKAKLSGGVAVISVGAATEVQMKALVQSFRDSLSSTKAAQEKGVVPGGGVAFLRASEEITSLNLTGEEAYGGEILRRACQVPTRLIAANAGLDGSVVLAEVQAAGGNKGYNVKTDTIEDLVAAGVIDPAKVLITSLTHAASVAGIILRTEALIADAPEDDE